MDRPLYRRVALIGLGLIAGSMAHAMRQAGLAGEIVGTARSAETRAVAAEIGLREKTDILRTVAYAMQTGLSGMALATGIVIGDFRGRTGG